MYNAIIKSKMSPFDMKSWELPALHNQSWLDKILGRAHKFFLTNSVLEVFAAFGDELICKKLFRLPFDDVLLEFHGANDGRFVMVGIQREGDKKGRDIAVVPYARQPDGSWSGGPDYTIFLDIAQTTWNAKESYETTDDPFWHGNQRFIADVFAASITMIGTNKAEQTEVTVSNKLAKARARRGKPPLFSYRVVDLAKGTSSTGGRGRGGTHASPALHWRRGHFRQLPNGVIPVAPCVVGFAENGVIVKDYDACKMTPREE